MKLPYNPLKKEIDNLNQQAYELRVSDSLKAFELSKQAFEKAKASITLKVWLKGSGH